MSPDVRKAVERAGLTEKYLTDPQMRMLVNLIEHALDLMEVVHRDLGIDRGTTEQVRRHVLDAMVYGYRGDLTAQMQMDQILPPLDAPRAGLTRADILAAFDVTEDDLAGLDPDGSYAAARADAARQRAEFLDYAGSVIARTEAEMAAVLNVRGGDRDG